MTRSRLPHLACTTALTLALAVSLAVVGLGAGPAAAKRVTVTPRSFTGYGFDQCVAPTQAAMNAWLRHSPFWAVGIYISGDSRGCRDQPNLTPEWVHKQLRGGWRLLPITLGPQASCSTRFPRYGDDETIDPSPRRRYHAARRQGKAEARRAVAAASALGIGRRSTLWYDLEAFDVGDKRCRRSAMWFLHSWTKRLQRLGYVSGVYSSAASGIRMLDDARVRGNALQLPRRVWIADWNGRADVESAYIRRDGWRPGHRVHQYLGGHDETWGGVTINIDSNFLDLGRGSVARRDPRHCGGVDLDHASYPLLRPGTSGALVLAAQCLLREQGAYAGRLHGRFTPRMAAAVRAYRGAHRLAVRDVVQRGMWVSLLSQGPRPLMKYGAGRDAVRRLQRALTAATRTPVPVTGTFEALTTSAVRDYQRMVDRTRSGVVTKGLWKRLQAGRI